MDSVFRYVQERSARLAAHPLFTWVRDTTIPLDRRLSILPPLAPFAMGYRDICRWALTYPDPRGPLEAAINAHAAEDATHSGLFLADWDAMDLDSQLGWSAGDVLWWMFAAPQTAVIRRAGTRMLAMPVADGGDPLLRFAWAEVIEACGAVFFGVIAPLADQLAGQAGRESRYLGPYHLARESGHVDGEELFAAQELTDRQRARALSLARETFGLFEAIFSCLLEYGMAYPAQGRVPARRLAAAAVVRAAAPRGPAAVAPGLQPAGRLLEERRARTAQHPAYQWLRSAAERPAADRLAALLPDWALSIMGYPELLHVICTAGGGPADAGSVCTWAESLAGHGAAFLADWDALGVDERLGWTASEALRWLYLDPRTEAHRRNMAAFTRLAASAATPLTRLWLLDALEASGEAWFATCQGLASEVERQRGCRLDYLAGRLEVPAPDHGRFRESALSPAEAPQVAHSIGVVFDAVDEQLTLTLRSARAAGDLCASS